MATVQNESQIEEKELFDNIALCISGGGFRAASFGLGVLSYLNHFKIENDKSLLQNVSYLSTTSGGSILAAVYMKSLCSREPFVDFYSKATKFMKGEIVLEKALKKLSDYKEWKDTEKSRNLINSFAKVYDDYLDGQTFEEYWKNRSDIHIKANCYNATEFNTGITFRFQTTDRSLIGNNYVRLTEESAQKLKVADIIAASSCFPAGFEPLLYPDDFSTNQIEKKQLTDGLTISNPYDEKVSPPFALMDGGITDNQGIESMMMADGNVKKKKFSFAIIADVSNKYMSPWSSPKRENKDKISINRILTILKWVSVPLLLVSLYLLVYQSGEIPKLIGALLLGPSILFTFLWSKWKSLVESIKNVFDKNDNISWDKIMRPYLKYFGSLPYNDLKYLIEVRLTSVAMLAYDIFLKQVRRMRYDELYESKEWEGRRVSSLIYELNQKNQKFLEEEILDKEKKGIYPIGTWELIKPSVELQEAAQYASEMGTTLWFDEDDEHNNRLNKLIATGQATICFNLLDFVIKAEFKNPSIFLQKLKNDLLADWARFNNDPLFLVK